jgi:hypothetical protein
VDSYIARWVYNCKIWSLSIGYPPKSCMVKDLVCSMMVDEKTAKYVSEVEGVKKLISVLHSARVGFRSMLLGSCANCLYEIMNHVKLIRLNLFSRKIPFFFSYDIVRSFELDCY